MDRGCRGSWHSYPEAWWRLTASFLHSNAFLAGADTFTLCHQGNSLPPELKNPRPDAFFAVHTFSCACAFRRQDALRTLKDERGGPDKHSLGLQAGPAPAEPPAGAGQEESRLPQVRRPRLPAPGRDARGSGAVRMLVGRECGTLLGVGGCDDSLLVRVCQPVSAEDADAGLAELLGFQLLVAAEVTTAAAASSLVPSVGRAPGVRALGLGFRLANLAPLLAARRRPLAFLDAWSRRCGDIVKASSPKVVPVPLISRSFQAMIRKDPGLIGQSDEAAKKMHRQAGTRTLETHPSHPLCRWEREGVFRGAGEVAQLQQDPPAHQHTGPGYLTTRGLMGLSLHLRFQHDDAIGNFREAAKPFL